MLGAAINQTPTRDPLHGSISNHKLTKTCKPINHNANDHKSRPQIAGSAGFDYNTIMIDYTTGRLTVKRTLSAAATMRPQLILAHTRLGQRFALILARKPSR